MIGVDTNLLLALALSSHPNHSGALAAFERELAAGGDVAISLSVAAEFFRVITDPKRLTPPLEMSEAIRWFESWIQKVEPVWLNPGDAAIATWFAWTIRFQLGRKRILDTQYAALLQANGIRRVLTNNKEDFEVFKVFDIQTF
jgi:predicted nucleic acid-binding protein